MVMLLFEEGDADASGDLTYEELFDIICELHKREGVEFTEEQVGMQLDQAYAEFDADDDGAISFDEFLDMFCRSTAFAVLPANLWSQPIRRFIAPFTRPGKNHPC